MIFLNKFYFQKFLYIINKIAIEYYESIRKTEIFNIFQNKMRNLMLKPNVIMVLNKSSNTKNNKEEEKSFYEELEKHEEEIKINQRKNNYKKTAILAAHEIKESKKVIQDQEKEIVKVKFLIKEEISKQTNEILERIEKRKKNRRSSLRNMKNSIIEENNNKQLKQSKKKFILNLFDLYQRKTFLQSFFKFLN